MEINLLPWRDEILDINKDRLLKMLGAAVLLGLVGIFLMYRLFFGELAYTRSYIAELEKAKAGLAGSMQIYAKEKRINDSLSERLDLLRKHEVDRFVAVRLLNDLSKLIPKGVYLSEITRDGDDVNISGFATSNAIVSTFMDKIDHNPDMKVGALKNVRSTESGVGMVQFDLDIKLTFHD